MKHLRRNHFIKTIASTVIYKIIKNGIFSQILVLICLKHIYMTLSAKNKIQKITFYHILAIIQLAYVAKYAWFWSDG